MPDVTPFSTLAGALRQSFRSLAAWAETRAVGAPRASRDRLRTALRWTRDADAQAAFAEAVADGIASYEAASGKSRAARAVATALAEIARDPDAPADRDLVLRPALDPSADLAALRAKVVGKIPAKQRLRSETVGAQLEALYREHLTPAVHVHPHFTQRATLDEAAEALRQIRDRLPATPSDDELDTLEAAYCKREAKGSELLTMQGLSPRVRNDTVGLNLRDVYTPVLFDSGGGARLEVGFDSAWTTNWDDALKAGLPFEDHGPEIGPDPQTWLEPQPYRRTRSIPSNPFLQTVGLAGRLFAPSQPLSQRLVGADPRLQSPPSSLLWWGRSFSAEDLLRQPQVVVQGDPGGGKSTFALHVHHAAASGNATGVGETVAAAVPIHARAIDIGDALAASSDLSFEQYLLSREDRYRPALERALVTGRALVIVDGLDEVREPHLRARVKDSLHAFMADPALDGTRLLVTTRIVGYQRDGASGALPHVTVQPFSDEQIEACVRAWIQAMPPTSLHPDPDADAQLLLDAIRANAGVKRLARNPLLLTIIVLIHWQGRALPSNRALLYDVAIHTLIKTWPMAQRRIDLDDHFLREWIAPVARHVFEAPGTDVVSDFELKRLLVESMLRLKTVTETEARDDTDQLLEDVATHTGLLAARGTDADGREVYGFSHQTFAEYLTAFELAQEFDRNELDTAALLADDRWREVLLLLAGYLGNQSRQRAGALVRRIRTVDEGGDVAAFLQRGTLRAGAVLADGVQVGPPSLVRELGADLVSLALHSPVRPLRDDARVLLAEVVTTEYGPELGRIAVQAAGSAADVLALAPLVGVEPFRARLGELLAAGSVEGDAEVDNYADRAAVLLFGTDSAAETHLRATLLASPRRQLALRALADVDRDAAEALLQQILDSGEEITSALAASVYSTSSRLGIPYLREAAGAFDNTNKLEDYMAMSVTGAVRQAGAGHIAEVLAEATTLPRYLIDPVRMISLALHGEDGAASKEDVEALRDDSSAMLRRAVAIAALRTSAAALDDQADWAWATARDALELGDANEQLAAASIFAGIEPDAVQRALRPLLANEDPRVRFEAATFLQGDQQAEDVLWDVVIQAKEPWPGGAMWTKAAQHLYDAHGVDGPLDELLHARVRRYASEDKEEARLALQALGVWVEQGRDHQSAVGADLAWASSLHDLVEVFRWASRRDAVEESPPGFVGGSLGFVWRIAERAASGFGGDAVAEAFDPLIDNPSLRPLAVQVVAASPASGMLLRERAASLLEGPDALDADTHAGRAALDALYRSLTA